MAEVRIQYNFTAEDLVKANRTTSYNIDGLREWLHLMPTIPHLSDEQIAIFLIACKNDTEATKNCIVCFFKYKAAAPELFSQRDLEGDEMTHSFKVSSVAIMPQRTKENYSVIVGSLKDTSYSNFNLDSQCKVVFMYLDYILHENPPAGLIVVLNLKGVGLMHITRLKLSTVKKFFAFLQEALPTQLKHIHILNTSYVFDKILVILKPFMNKELFNMIITHPPNADMETFFKDHISKDIFPSDFGGSLPNLEQLAHETRYKCRKMRSYLDACENQVQSYEDNRR